MAHTYSKMFYHLIWSTKNRRPFIHSSIKENIYNYIEGILINKNCILHEINGMPDHVHILISMPLNLSISDLVQQIKIHSTKWIKTQNFDLKEFGWQQGLGVYTVSYSAFESVKQYILNQEEHHKKMSFEEEYVNFLKKMNIKFDERFVLD